MLKYADSSFLICIMNSGLDDFCIKMQDFLSKSAKKSRIRDLQAVASEV